jgi:hypothetical protein
MAATATATRKDVQEVLDYERRFWEATKAGDGSALGKLTADQFTFVMGEGVNNFPRDEFVKMMTAGDYRLKSFTLDEKDATVRELAPGVAAVAYHARSSHDLGGKPGSTDGYWCSIWVKDGRDWKCSVVTESPKHS